MASTLQIEGNNVVLVGSFNPAIFSPLWLLTSDLIGQQEFDSATIDIIHPEVTSFRTDWVQITVEQQRVSFISLGPVSIKVFDLICRIFGEVLPHTPLTAMGINFVSHFSVHSEGVLHRFGDALAPKEPWGAWGETLAEVPPKGNAMRRSSASRAGGLRTMTMAQYVRPDGLRGHIHVKVEPSLQFQPGLYVEVNNHVDFDKPSKGADNGSVLKPFYEKFDKELEFARGFVTHFMKFAEGFEREDR